MPAPRSFLALCAAIFVVAGFTTFSAPAPAATEPFADSATPMQQLFILKELKPDLERVGLLCNAETADDEALFQTIQRAAAAAGVKIFMAKIGNRSDVAPMYRSLLSEHDIQALWVVDQSGAMAEASSRTFLIRQAVRSRIPILAPTDVWVDEGAPVTLQAAEGTIRLIMNQATASALALSVPEKYNDRTEYRTSD